MKCNIIPISVKMIIKPQPLGEPPSVYAEVRVHCFGFVKTPGTVRFEVAWHTDYTQFIAGPASPTTIGILIQKYKNLVAVMPPNYKRGHDVPYIDLKLGAHQFGASVGPEIPA